jgi:iron complex outermembrane receptor protein
LDIRKNATQLQDSIVAEDIGKLPDNNVVEALQHVSGISILRNSVEPGTVLIRGLPDIATTLSGRQIFTASTNGRFISLPDLPAELLARVDVKKTASAEDLEGGIAGLIDVRLHVRLQGLPGRRRREGHLFDARQEGVAAR